MKKTSKILSVALALVMCLSLLPTAAFAAGEGEKTLPDQILEPGKTDIIDKANDTAEKLEGDINSAMNPTVDGKPENVLNKADEAIENAGDTKDKINGDLTVGEDEDGKPVTVDKVVSDAAAEASDALEDAKTAADAAAEAAKAGNEAALAAAWKAAEVAAEKAEIAYNKAQDVFDSVIGNLLDDDELDQAIADAGIEVVEKPGENATQEEKEAYSAYLTALNNVKTEAANAKIEAMYGEANGKIDAAKAALKTALDNLANADEANKAALKLVSEYVGWTEAGEKDDIKAGEIYGAYTDLKDKTNAANDAAQKADAKEPEGSTATTPEERIERDSVRLAEKGTYISGDFQLQSAVQTVKENSVVLIQSMEALKTETDPEKRAELWETINEAKVAIFDRTYDYADSSTGTLIQTAYGLIELRDKTNHNQELLDQNKGVRAAMQCIIANLDAVEAQYNQLMAEEAFNKSLAGLGYKQALEVVKAFEEGESYEDVKAAAENAYATAKAEAAAAQEKAKAAQQAYKDAQTAVQAAIEKLKELEDEKLGGLDRTAFEEAQKALEDANKALDKAKDDKDKAEEEQKKAEDEVIIIETIIGGGSGDDDFFFDDGLTDIEDEAVPLAAGPVTRGEFIDYLWRHEGEPASDGVCTFTDVAADYEYLPALAWAEQTGIAEANEDGTFEPDELVTVVAVREFLDNFAEIFGTNAVAADELTTLTGEDDEAVLNCDEVIAEFFGEELPEVQEAA